MFYRDTATYYILIIRPLKKIVYKKKKMADGSFRKVEKDDQFNPPARNDGGRKV